MKILVCGPRVWVEQRPIEQVLQQFPRGTTLIHGGARGADSICGYVAEQLGFEVRAYPVEHALDGPWPAAGHYRNARMLRSEHPHSGGSLVDRALVFALAKVLSKGTANMAEKLRRAEPAIDVREVRWIRGELLYV